MVERMGIGAQHRDARDRDRAGDDPGPESACPEPPFEVAIGNACGVGGQKHCGDVGGGGDGEHAHE